MIRIKVNLFESICCAILFPNIGLIITTFLFSISLIHKQDPIVYKALLISYIMCTLLMILSLLLCILINKKSKKEFVVSKRKIDGKNYMVITNVNDGHDYLFYRTNFEYRNKR